MIRSTSPIDTVLSKLHGVRPGTNGNFKTHCPAHDDSKPSLSVREADDRRVLLNCFAGCDPDAIVEALGLRWSDLFPSREPERPKPSRGKLRNKTAYVARDWNGSPLVRHVRWDYENDKSIWWEQLDGQRGLGEIRLCDLPLYGSHEAVPGKRKAVIIVEGEKARDALANVGVDVLGTYGADHEPDDEVLRPITAWDTIYLWPDRDRSGLLHMRKLTEQLCALGHGDVRIIYDPDAEWKDDAFDWVARGGDCEALKRLCSNAIDAHAYLGTDEAPGPLPAGSVGIYETVDIEQLLAGDDESEPLVDGLLVRGHMTAIGAYPGVGKTTLATALIAALIEQKPALGILDVKPLHGRIVYFSELSHQPLRHTLDVLDSVYQIPPETIAKHLRVYRLAAVPAADPDAHREFVDNCAGADVVILDTFDDWLGDNPNRTEIVLEGWHILREVAQTGAALLVFDHSGKTVIGYDDRMAAVAGASAKLRQPDLVYSMKSEDSPDRHNTLKPVKERIRGIALELRLPVNGRLEAVELTQDGADRNAVTAAKQCILGILAKGAIWRTREIEQSARHAGHALRTVERALRDLKRTGEIHQPARGQYAIGPRTGKSEISQDSATPIRKDVNPLAESCGFSHSDGPNVPPNGAGGTDESEDDSEPGSRQHSAEGVAGRLANVDGENAAVPPARLGMNSHTDNGHDACHATIAKLRRWVEIGANRPLRESPLSGTNIRDLDRKVRFWLNEAEVDDRPSQVTCERLAMLSEAIESMDTIDDEVGR